MLHFTSVLHMSILYCRQTSIWPIYISTTSGSVNSSSTIHFNTCVCWLEIHVQITRVAISTFFHITLIQILNAVDISFCFGVYEHIDLYMLFTVIQLYYLCLILIRLKHTRHIAILFFISVFIQLQLYKIGLVGFMACKSLSYFMSKSDEWLVSNFYVWYKKCIFTIILIGEYFSYRSI